MSIEVRATDQATILDLTEDLIAPAHEEDLKEAIEKLLEGDPPNVLVNFGNIQFFKPWKRLAHYAPEFRHHGKEIKVFGLTPQLKKHFGEVMHLSDVIESYETEEEALDSFTDNVSQVERNILFGKLKS